MKKSKTVYTVISSKSYVRNPEKLSGNPAAYFVPKTKKGIQATNINEVTGTKSKKRINIMARLITLIVCMGIATWYSSVIRKEFR